MAPLAGADSGSRRRLDPSSDCSLRQPARRRSAEAPLGFAGDFRLSNQWAEDLYRRARARGHDHPDTGRVLARAWLYVIWRCCQDATRYDPDQRCGLQRVLDAERSADNKPTDAVEVGDAGPP